MTGHYARLHDTTVRRHWEAARKVNIAGQTVILDPDGPLADAAWAKQRLGRATQALPNGYCGLPVQKTCPHANACLTCPMFITTPEFLPQHRDHRQQILQIITAAEARGQTRLAEMNRQVLTNLDTIITSLHQTPAPRRPPPMRADNTGHLAIAARRRHELTRAKAIRALRELARSRNPGHLRARRPNSRSVPVLALLPARHPRPDPATPQHHPASTVITSSRYSASLRHVPAAPAASRQRTKPEPHRGKPAAPPPARRSPRPAPGTRQTTLFNNDRSPVTSP